METEVIMKRSSIAPAPTGPGGRGQPCPRFLTSLLVRKITGVPARVMPQGPHPSRREGEARREAERPFRGGFGFSRGNYFFWTYFRQSSMTATRMMMPENTNWRLASMPRVVRE